MIHKFGFLLLSVLIACVNNNKNRKLEDSAHVSSQMSQRAVKAEDTMNSAKRGAQSEIDSLENYDLYQFENDTLVQAAYIRYMSPRKIQFILRTKNKKSLNTCEYRDTAKMANGEGTAQASDELNDDELYGVYEYFTNKKVFFTIDIEFKRGKRMTVFTKADTGLCRAGCPLSSKGTLRRKNLSREKQSSPSW